MTKNNQKQVLNVAVIVAVVAFCVAMFSIVASHAVTEDGEATKVILPAEQTEPAEIADSDSPANTDSPDNSDNSGDDNGAVYGDKEANRDDFGLEAPIPSEFTNHLNRLKSLAENLHKEGDSAEVDKLISAVQNGLKNYAYDESKTLEQNVTAVDEIYYPGVASVEAQRETDFNSAKGKAIESIQGAKKAGDSEKVDALISESVDAINEITYTSQMSPAELQAIIDEICEDFTAAVEEDRLSNFDQERADALDGLDALNDDNQPKSDEILINKAIAAVEALEYDSSDSPAGNKDKIEVIVTDCQDKLVNLRVSTYYIVKDAAVVKIGALVKEGDSDAIKNHVKIALGLLNLIDYDKTKNLTENKDTIEELSQAAEELVNNQRAADGVTAKIQALPRPATLDDEVAVVDARNSYDALTEDQKELVSEENLKVLEQAEKEIADGKAKQKEEGQGEQGGQSVQESVTSSTSQTGDNLAVVLIPISVLALVSGAYLVSRSRMFN